MKILALTPTYLPFMGGIEIFADVLARTLRHRSVETVIVADSGGESSRFEVVNGTPVHRLALISAIISRNAAAPLVVLQEIGKLLEAERPDVIHLHSATQAGAFYLDRILRNLRHRPPLVVTQHGVLLPSDKLGVTRKLLIEADVVTGVSDAVLKSSIGFSGRTGRSEMIFNGVEPPEHCPSERWLPKHHSLLCVGRMQREKGYDLAIEALCKIRGFGIDADLSLIGRGEDQPLFEALAQTVGVREHVHFLGTFDHAATRRAIGACSLLLVPSRTREGFGLVAAEAAFAGTPCIASRAGGLPEVVEDGETGRLVNVEDSAGLALAAADLLQNEAEWRRLSYNARQRAPARFDLDCCIQSYIKLYKSLI